MRVKRPNPQHWLVKRVKDESVLGKRILRLGKRELMKIFVSRFVTLAMLLLIAVVAHAVPQGLGGFTPNPEVTISFREDKYFIGTQQNADITITGPSGTYKVSVTGPGTDTSILLEIGGKPGGNTGSVKVNIPSTVGDATYTAKATIGGTPVEDSATVEAADIVVNVSQGVATPNAAQARVGQPMYTSLAANVGIPSFGASFTSGPTWDWEFVSVRHRSSETEPWIDFYGLDAEITWYPSQSTASYVNTFNQAGEYEIKVKATVSVVVNGQTYSNSQPATAYVAN